jgi:hypothetical protein
VNAAARRPSLVRELVFILAAWAGTFVFMALIALVVAVVAWLLLGALNVLPDPDRRWPRLSAWAVVAIPLVALFLAFVLSRRSHGDTFYEQQRANRRTSWLLLVTMVGLVTALGEAVAASLTFDSVAALAGAGLAAIAGAGGAAYAHFRGANAVLDSARARPADDAGDTVLNDVVAEMSIAANIPRPRVYVIADESMNAMAVGTRPDNAAVAVTTGLLRRMDREQLQGSSPTRSATSATSTRATACTWRSWSDSSPSSPMDSCAWFCARGRKESFSVARRRTTPRVPLRG